jgi:hypothetical protein
MGTILKLPGKKEVPASIIENRRAAPDDVNLAVHAAWSRLSLAGG